MFKQAKSALIWYHLYKFKKTLIVVVLLLSMVLFSQWIYSDIVEYLKLRDKLQYLDILLPLKWGIIFFNIGLSVYLLLSLFKGEKKEEKKTTKKEQTQKKYEPRINEEKKEEKKEEQFSDREKKFLYKKKLKNKADVLLDEK